VRFWGTDKAIVTNWHTGNGMTRIKEYREMKMRPSLERALRHKEILKA
jgi:hypothetical protein